MAWLIFDVGQKMIEQHIAKWTADEQQFDRVFAISDTAASRLTTAMMLRPATKVEVVRETDRLAALERKRVAAIEEKMRGNPNLPQILSGFESQAQMSRKKRDVFLKYFSLPQAMVHWFEDREVGIVGWGVESRGKIVRAFLLKAESFPR